ncbi:MAG TPA: hypothetical protein VMS98_08425 [Thermoanaerobaculia bacterium]|nr:hypothetical protein [Thermoanaerobaculia bacterium]
MAKSKKNSTKARKPSVKVQDLAPEQDPAGGVLSTSLKLDTSLKLADKSVLPAIQLNSSRLYK